MLLFVPGLFLFWIATAGGPAKAANPSTTQIVAERMVSALHTHVTVLNAFMGVTPDQKPAVNEVEQKADDAIRADTKVYNKTFITQFDQDYRAVLTPDQQKKFDDGMAAHDAKAGAATRPTSGPAGAKSAEKKNAATTAKLKHLGRAIANYQKKNTGKVPQDWGSLLAPGLGGQAYLLPESAGKLPRNFDRLDKDARADWVNANSDFVLKLTGQTVPQTGADFVVAYIKPELATDGNLFLMGDGSVKEKSADDAKSILADLDAGKNPPPSMK